jgi:short subunit dehydrogenase-like uncharacterized protein
MSEIDREFDIVLWGATGFTGQLVARYLLERYGVDGSFRWALGGRNEAKLESVRDGLGAAALPIVLGDGDDEASLVSSAPTPATARSSSGPAPVVARITATSPGSSIGFAA